MSPSCGWPAELKWLFVRGDGMLYPEGWIRESFNGIARRAGLAAHWTPTASGTHVRGDADPTGSHGQGMSTFTTKSIEQIKTEQLGQGDWTSGD